MWFANLFSSVRTLVGRGGRRRSTRRRLAPRRLLCEALEDRCLLSYAVIDLGSLPGIQSISYAAAVNDSAQVAGTAYPYGGQRAFVWDPATGMHDLGSLGGSLSASLDINNLGQVIGTSYVPDGHVHGFLITPEDTNADGTPDLWFRDNDLDGVNDLMLDLGYFYASAINDVGQVVGWATAADGQAHAFLWDIVNGMQDLGTFGGTSSYASDINNAGQVVGRAETTYIYSGGFTLHPPTGVSEVHSFLWDPIGGTTLLTPLSGQTCSVALAINDAGEVVGSSGTIILSGQQYYYKSDEAVLWEAGIVTGLGKLPGATDSVAYDINQAGQVIGDSGGSPFLWVDGVITDLISLLDTPVGGTLGPPVDTNAVGQIVVNSEIDGQTHALLLTPVTTSLLRIDDVAVVEGSSGTASAVFTVTRSGPLDLTATVDFVTADANATAATDYAPVSGTLTFAPGERTKTITVSVTSDTRDEVDETFVVNLSNPTNAVLVDGQGAGTILDDDPPALTISDVTRVEGNSGITYFVLTVSLSAPCAQTVTVNFATANGTAKAGEDFTAASGTLTFAPGETTMTITVKVKGDKKKEANETFFVNLSGASNALLADSQGLGTILNDD